MEENIFRTFVVYFQRKRYKYIVVSKMKGRLSNLVALEKSPGFGVEERGD